MYTFVFRFGLLIADRKRDRMGAKGAEEGWRGKREAEGGRKGEGETELGREHHQKQTSSFPPRLRIIVT